MRNNRIVFVNLHDSMPMKKIAILLSLAVSGAVVSACSDDEDVFGTQKNAIVSFLEQTHQPRLVAEEEVEEGSRAGFYTLAGDAVYRYIDIEDCYNPDRGNRPAVSGNSRVTIVFRAYVFQNRIIAGLPDGGLTESNFSSVTPPFFANDPAYEPYFRMAGLTPGAWKFEPLVLDMRDPGIIKGLHRALLGCRQGDRVEAYMTYNMAYGDKTYMYMIPKNTPVAVFFSVDKVE